MPKIKLTEVKVLNAFIRQLMADKGLDLGPEETNRAVEELRGQIEQQIDRALISRLSDEQAMTLEQLLDNGASEDEIHEFWQGTGVPAEEVTLDVMKAFREGFMATNWEEEE